MSDLPRLLTTREVSQYLGCSLQALYDARRRGDGPPYIKIAHNFVRYDVEKLEAWLAERERTRG